jgi:hypothetical protein
VPYARDERGGREKEGGREGGKERVKRGVGGRADWERRVKGLGSGCQKAFRPSYMFVTSTCVMKCCWCVCVLIRALSGVCVCVCVCVCVGALETVYKRNWTQK